MELTYLLGAASMGYLLLYRFRLQELALRLKNEDRSRKGVQERRPVLNGPQLALAIHLLALLSFVLVAWTMVSLALDFLG